MLATAKSAAKAAVPVIVAAYILAIAAVLVPSLSPATVAAKFAKPTA